MSIAGPLGKAGSIEILKLNLCAVRFFKCNGRTCSGKGGELLIVREDRPAAPKIPAESLTP